MVLTSPQLFKTPQVNATYKEHVMSKDDKGHNEDRVKRVHTLCLGVRTTYPFTFREREREQWNLRNIGPHLNKVCKRG